MPPPNYGPKKTGPDPMVMLGLLAVVLIGAVLYVAFGANILVRAITGPTN